MAIVLNSDFVGKYELSLTAYNTPLIDSYINKYEKQYLIKLLGKELYDLFIDDLVSGVPQSAIYTKIYNELCVSTFCEGVISSKGIKEMLIGFIYYHYTLDNEEIQTPTGTKRLKSENSDNVTISSLNYSRFNDNVESFQTIQYYIQENSSDYPTFNGSEIRLKYSL